MGNTFVEKGGESNRYIEAVARGISSPLTGSYEMAVDSLHPVFAILMARTGCRNDRRLDTVLLRAQLTRPCAVPLDQKKPYMS